MPRIPVLDVWTTWRNFAGVVAVLRDLSSRFGLVRICARRLSPPAKSVGVWRLSTIRLVLMGVRRWVVLGNLLKGGCSGRGASAWKGTGLQGTLEHRDIKAANVP